MFSLHRADETLLPKAIDCVYRRAEATAYGSWCMSGHGAAYHCVRKIDTEMIPLDGATKPLAFGSAKARVSKVSEKRR